MCNSTDTCTKISEEHNESLYTVEMDNNASENALLPFSPNFSLKMEVIYSSERLILTD